MTAQDRVSTPPAAAPRSLLITSDLGESWFAGLERGRLSDLRLEPAATAGDRGAIVSARVLAVESSPSSAWVDAGLGERCFVPLTASQAASLKAGRTLIVEIVRERSAGKGPRARATPRLAGWRVVLLPGGSRIRFSARLTDPRERERLADGLRVLAGQGHGYIVRAGAQGAPVDRVVDEARTLEQRWSEIERRAADAGAPVRLVEPRPPLARFLLEQLDARVAEIVVDGAESLRLVGRLRDEAGEPFPRVGSYRGPLPAFDAHGIGRALEEALGSRVELPGQGALTFDSAEAGTVVDVDARRQSGGPRRPSVTEINLEAAAELARQVRLRNLSGLLLVDFIDMRRAQERARVDERLRARLALDPCPARSLDISDFGVAQITRERRGPALHELLLGACARCGSTRAPTPPAEARRLLRILRHLARFEPSAGFRASAPEDVLAVARRLFDEHGASSGLPDPGRVAWGRGALRVERC